MAVHPPSAVTIPAGRRRGGGTVRAGCRPPGPENFVPEAFGVLPAGPYGPHWERGRRGAFRYGLSNEHPDGDTRIPAGADFVSPKRLSRRTSPSPSRPQVKTFLPISAPPPRCCHGCWRADPVWWLYGLRLCPRCQTRTYSW